MDLLEEIDAAFVSSMEVEQRLPQAITCQLEGVLLPEDIRDYLDEHGKLTTTQKAAEKDVRVLREKHHSVARLVAEEVPHGVIATITGYTASYLSVLLTAPAMIELVEHYRAPGNAAAKQIGETLKRVAGMAVERLETKIEEDQLSPSELTAVAKLGYDRSGHGPSSSVHAVTEHYIIPPEEITKRHREARQRDSEYIIHPEEVRPALMPPAKESDDATATE